MLSHGSKLFSIDIDFFFFLAITENVMWHVWVSYPEVPSQTRFISYPSWFIVLWNIFIFQGFFLFVCLDHNICVFSYFFKGFPVIICFSPPPVFLKRLMKFCYSLIISTISSNIHLAKFRWSRKILLYSRVL